MFLRTVSLLKRGPVHVDVGFVRQVDLTRSPVNGSSLIHTLQLQVLYVLNTQTHTLTLSTDRVKAPLDTAAQKYASV